VLVNYIRNSILAPYFRDNAELNKHSVPFTDTDRVFFISLQSLFATLSFYAIM